MLKIAVMTKCKGMAESRVIGKAGCGGVRMKLSLARSALQKKGKGSEYIFGFNYLDSLGIENGGKGGYDSSWRSSQRKGRRVFFMETISWSSPRLNGLWKASK